MNWGAATLALLGHGLLWLGVFNRLHGTALRPPVLKTIELLIALWSLVFCTLLWRSSGFDSADLLPPRTPTAFYATFCLCVLCVALTRWLWLRMQGPPRCLIDSRSLRIDVTDRLGFKPAGNWIGRICTSLPGNEILTLEVVEKVVALRRLPRALDGLKIAHWSDLHFTGRIGREYFEFVTEETLRRAPDMIVVTGDIHDTWACRDWFETTIGRLTAPNGVFFILGNHDLRPGRTRELRSILESYGLIDLGGKVLRREILGTEILLAGNELPWFGPQPACSEATRSKPQDASSESPPLRILLSHSPDQIGWAIRNRFDLVLAGHTHGGQICPPVIGPIVAPSRYGVRFAGGLFQVDSTVMHVSRGLSGEEPIRYGCPPELAVLQLRAASDRIVR